DPGERFDRPWRHAHDRKPTRGSGAVRRRASADSHEVELLIRNRSPEPNPLALGRAHLGERLLHLARQRGEHLFLELRVESHPRQEARRKSRLERDRITCDVAETTAEPDLPAPLLRALWLEIRAAPVHF